MGTERLGSRFLKFAGYLVPLVQSLPAWTGLMTLPFAGYLILVFTNTPVNLPRALFDFFVSFPPLEKVFVIIGFFVLVYSAAYMATNRKEGFVASGPYLLVWHPQYLGIILFTIGLTSWSVWILENTFSIGFLSSSQTIGVWFLELFVYVLLARTEERRLSLNHRKSFEKYKSQVPFFIPFLKTNKAGLDILISILVPTFLLFGLLAIDKISLILMLLL